MKITVGIIPFNFSKCLQGMLEFFSVYENRDVEFDINVMDNSTKDVEIDKIVYICKQFTSVNIVHRKNVGGLKGALVEIYKIAKEKGSDGILLCEHDLILNAEVMDALIEVYRNPFKTPIDSVSPMYKWKGTFCYPTNKSWFTGGLNEENGRKVYDKIGIVADPGERGVPFLCSLWTLEAMSLLEDLELKNNNVFDVEFGNFLYGKGFHHLRCIEKSAGHYDTGMWSWHKRSKIK